MRFSIRSVLAATSVAAALSCLLFVVPAIVTILSILIIGTVTPAALVAGIVYGRGYFRAFGIGAFISCVWMPFSFAVYAAICVTDSMGEFDKFIDQADDKAVILKIFFALECVFILTAGAVAVAVRWFCTRVARRQANISSCSAPPETVLIDPRDKVDLYAILQGRMPTQPAASAANGNSTTG